MLSKSANHTVPTLISARRASTDGAKNLPSFAAAQETAKADPSHSLLHSIYVEQSTSLVRYLTRRVADREEALDIAQEAWIRLLGHDAIERLNNPRAYLYQTANNLAIDRARRRDVERRYASSEAAGSGDFDAGPTAEQGHGAAQKLAAVYSTLEQLPSQTRDAFLLHRVRQLPYAAIAEALGVSSSMVEKHIIRALKELRKLS
ncbi:MAG: RNA polymerase sigma factor [Pseudomonadota bacterium]